jgi:hypothetical protein
MGTDRPVNSEALAARGYQRNLIASDARAISGLRLHNS